MGTSIIITTIVMVTTDLFRLVESVGRNIMSGFAAMRCTIHMDAKRRATIGNSPEPVG